MLPVIALGLAAAGAAANYIGQKAESRRRDRAISAYKERMARINRIMLAALANSGRIEQQGQYDAIAGSGAPAMAAAAQSEDARTAEIGSRLAALSADVAPAGDAAAPTAQAVSYARAQSRALLGERAQNLVRLLGEQGRQRQVIARDAAVPYAANAPALATSQARYRIDAQDAQAALDRVMGTTGNAALNWQLAGALANTGAKATYSYVGSGA